MLLPVQGYAFVEYSTPGQTIKAKDALEARSRKAFQVRQPAGGPSAASRRRQQQRQWLRWVVSVVLGAPGR